MDEIISDDLRGNFARDGVVVIPGFYEVEKDIVPVQQAIHAILGALLKKYRVPLVQPSFTSARFDTGYQELLALDRKIGGEVYDAVKQIPAFMRFAAHPRHDALFSELRPGSLPGVAGGGLGIRINNPHEERYRAPWHQDYLAQLRSLDGLVFWSPLVEVTDDLGPVEFCLGSQCNGPMRVHTTDPSNPDKSGAYSLIIENESDIVARYPKSAPLSRPGDLVLIDYHVIHRSGFNRAERSLWTMQIRYFNFLERSGIEMGWRGSFATGKHLRDVLPQLVED